MLKQYFTDLAAYNSWADQKDRYPQNNSRTIYSYWKVAQLYIGGVSSIAKFLEPYSGQMLRKLLLTEDGHSDSNRAAVLLVSWCVPVFFLDVVPEDLIYMAD